MRQSGGHWGELISIFMWFTGFTGNTEKPRKEKEEDLGEVKKENQPKLQASSKLRVSEKFRKRIKM